jgi:hypothetical protein
MAAMITAAASTAMAAALRPLCGGWARSGSPVSTPAPSCWACSVDKWVGVFTASIIATQRCIRSRGCIHQQGQRDFWTPRFWAAEDAGRDAVLSISHFRVLRVRIGLAPGRECTRGVAPLRPYDMVGRGFGGDAPRRPYDAGGRSTATPLRFAGRAGEGLAGELPDSLTPASLLFPRRRGTRGAAIETP